jgi:hypothetical protein
MSQIFGETKLIPIKQLKLDPDNPRLPESIQGASQTDLAIALDMGFDAFKVAESIAEHGYFASEPMIAIPGENKEEYIVVEGNRRLTAILGLTDQAVRSEFLDAGSWNVLAQNSKLKTGDNIPVVIAHNRMAVVPIMGWRHISGILAWKPFPQAKYIATLFDKHNLSAQEIATMIGMKKNDVTDLYREQAIAEQAKSMGIETGNLESAFSLLTVAMKNQKLRSFVGAPLSSQMLPGIAPIPKDKKLELKELLEYIFGSEENEPVISDSRKITTLANVVANVSGLAALREGKSLDEAQQKIAATGMSPQQRLLNRLTASKNSLELASEDIAGNGNNPEVLTLLDEIVSAVDTLKSSLEENND